MRIFYDLAMTQAQSDGGETDHQAHAGDPLHSRLADPRPSGHPYHNPNQKASNLPQDMIILTLPLPLRMGRVNCYLIQTAAGHVLIDTGGSNARQELHGQLESAGCMPGSLKLVLLTHGDFDHIGNAAYLRAAFGARLAMQRDDSGMAERGDMFVNRKKPNMFIRTLIPIFTGFGKSERFTPDVFLDDGDNLSQHGLGARIIGLPGHSKGSIGILTASGELFCGDLFENTKGPALNSLIDDPTAAKASVARLDALKIRTVYPGHGQPFAMELLAQTMHEPPGREL